VSLINAAAAYRRDNRSTLRVPVVMPLVEVTVDSTGDVSVLLDRDVYCADGGLQRDGLKGVLDDIAADLGTPIRVDVNEADGSRFTDIIAPPRPATEHPRGETAPRTRTALASAFGISGDGFTPGEQVDVCVVVARQIAEEDGTARLRLPPAVLADHPSVLLVGRASGAVALSKGAA
jgi:hypothetical protein